MLNETVLSMLTAVMHTKIVKTNTKHVITCSTSMMTMYSPLFELDRFPANSDALLRYGSPMSGPCKTTDKTNNRRRFLKVLGASATFIISCGDETGQSEARGDFPAGNVSALPVGTIKAISGQPLVIARDVGGIYAMSTICTHAQCDMNGGSGKISNTELLCDCHGSRFDSNGNVITGPATGQLKHYLVTINTAGEIMISADSAVSGGARVAVA